MKPHDVAGRGAVEWVDRASTVDTSAVLALADAATRADGTAPLSEQTLLELRHGAPAAQEALLRDAGGVVVGFAHLDSSDLVEGPTAELVVAPSARGVGAGRTLLRALVDRAGQGRAGGRPLRVWAHGAQPGARALAKSLGFRAFRELWQMRRPLSLELPSESAVEVAGVRIDTFRAGVDDAEWLRLNAAAFAHHPEQGQWSAEDLHRRMAEPWFEPEGFFLARRVDDGRLVGFHWTKVHPATAGEGPLGEVYVVGVDPQAQGGGLGRALTTVGLRHLARVRVDSRPLEQVLLYVDADNTAAVRVYSRLGFEVHTVDVMYRRPGGG